MRVVRSEFPNFYGKALLVSNQKSLAFYIVSLVCSRLLDHCRKRGPGVPHCLQKLSDDCNFGRLPPPQIFLISSAIDSSPLHVSLRLSSLVNYYILITIARKTGDKIAIKVRPKFASVRNIYGTVSNLFKVLRILYGTNYN